MNFNHQNYIKKYLDNPGNDATDYGVRLVEADVAEGETYWRVIGVHHLEPDENWGRSLVYVDAVDEMGQRIESPFAWADWTWEGRPESIPALPFALDKPVSEPAGQLFLFNASQRVSVWLRGLYADADDKSDRVEGIHTGHADELTADGQPGNAPWRHSFYIVFQRTRKGEAPAPAPDEEEGEIAPSFAAPVADSEAAISPRRSHKIGVDANRPIVAEHGPRQGAPSDTVANPDLIASSGAAWVRINFVLGPWLGPDDQTRFQGHTWAETYESIVDSFLNRGVNVYGLIGHESVRGSPDFFMDPPEEMLDHETSRAREWIVEYARNFREIVERFYPKVTVFESFNEPDNWHNGRQAWIHPHWFAHMLQAIHDQVRAGLGLGDVTLVSGPLQGLSINRNEAPMDYLRRTYKYGQDELHWGEDGRPYPFDGVGYHLYIHESYQSDWPSQESAVRETYRNYVNGIRQVIRAHEGSTSPKQLYISEIGWPSNRDTAEEKEFQAQNLSLALELMLNDPGVALGIWFCTEDFAPGSKFYGLYQMGRVAPEGRKQAFFAFQTICDRLNQATPEPEPVVVADYSNQVLITAFYRVAGQLGLDGWALMKRANVDPGSLVRDRQALYLGPDIDDLNLSDEERRLLKAALADLTRVIEDAVSFDVGPPAPVPAAEPGFLRLRPELADLPLAPPKALRIRPAAAENSGEERAVRIWNRYGWLLLTLADIFKFEPGVGVAVLAIESGGRGFAGDGRMMIRFENHIFFKHWGVHHPAEFDQHFRFDPNRRWLQHWWRPAPSADWQDFHARRHLGEWDVFEFARHLDSRAAMLSISMGAPQIMGFNHQILGYDSVETMFEAFSLSERSQLLGFFDFVCGPLATRERLVALQELDFEAFSARYNGLGQAAKYGGLLQAAFEAFQRLSPL